MSQEKEYRSSYTRTTDVFGLTDKEQLHDFISDSRFQAILQSEETTIHQVIIDTNNYGEFLFVSVSRSAAGKARFMTFWGAGFHEKRERWLIHEWRFYESYIRRFPTPIAKEEALQAIQKRQDEIIEESNPTPSQAAKLFVLLADLTDEDGASTELDDLDQGGYLFSED